MSRSNADALFEAAFFEGASRSDDRPGSRRRTASRTPDSMRDLRSFVAGAGRLHFASVKRHFPDVRVVETDRGYRLSGRGLIRCASTLFDDLASDNGRVNLKFSEDFDQFEPEDDLIHKSTSPLWIVKPTARGVVEINRIHGR